MKRIFRIINPNLFHRFIYYGNEFDLSISIKLIELFMIFGDFFRITPKTRKIKVRNKQGVLYSNPGMFKKTIFYVGNWLLVAAGCMLVYLYYPLGKAIVMYEWSQNSQKENVATNIPLPTPTPQPGFNITIPKILANSEIVADVSPFKREEYLKVLENDVVAQATGSDKPGLGPGKMTYIFAHSTTQSLDMLRKNSVFYLLGELKNDDIIFINKDGVVYTYIVYKQEVVKATQTEYLKYSEPDKEVLILQTCWPIGTNWKRLLVFAKRV